MAFVLISVIAALVAGFVAYRLAERKGRSAQGWMVATVLLLVPLLLLVLLPTKCPPAFPDPGACA